MSRKDSSSTQPQPIDFLSEIADFTFTSKYARYNDKEKRRETWHETVARLERMHLKRFSYLSKEDQAEIKWAFDRVREKLVAPSMRSLQFGGKAIEAHHARIFNCSVTHIHSLRSFAEVFYLLLCGCGVGIGLSNRFLDRLPDLVDPEDKSGTVVTYVIADTIEGWADSVEALLMCYFKNTAYTGRKIVFDYCVAPDTMILKRDLTWVRADEITEGVDIVAFDEHKAPGASNRRLLKGGKVNKIKRLRRPSVKIVTDRGTVTCSTEHRWLARQDKVPFGWMEAAQLQIGDEIAFSTSPWKVDDSRDGGWMAGLYDGEGWMSSTTLSVCQNEGVVLDKAREILDRAGVCYVEDVVPNKAGTKDNIRLRSANKWEAMKALGTFRPTRFMNRSDDLWMGGHSTGRGSVHARILSIEELGEQEVIAIDTSESTFIANGFLSHNSKIRKKGTPLKTGGGKAPGYKGLRQAHEQIKRVLDHIIEDNNQRRLKTINAYDILMHAADAVLSGGIRRSATSVVFDPEDEDMMNAKTFFKVDKVRRFAKDEDTGQYHGQVVIRKRVHDVVISEWEYTEQLKKEGKIGWFPIEPQRARSNNSVMLLRDKVTKDQFQAIVDKTRQFGEPGFVFASDSNTLYNPCFEISFIPITLDGVCGVQYCNLTTQNGRLITSKERFLEATKAATIIGTLQAAYTDFPYLSPAARKLTEDEALLGVSITGMMENPQVLLDPAIQREMAEYAVVINAEWARKVGINPAARITCVKPEGTSSLVLGTSSGIHPHHARRYFRRMQCNRIDNVFRHLRKANPHAVEESVWSATKTDDVVSFPLTIPEQAMVKADLTALKHLDIIRSTQQNWVLPGTTSANRKPIEHNVSCTVMVKDEEWQAVIDYLYENRTLFAAVSLLPATGDKIYQQAPMEAVTTEEDEKRWNALVEGWKHVDFTTLVEDDDETQMLAEASCAGGACEAR